MANADRIARAGIATVTAVVLAEEINDAISAKSQVAALTPIATADANDPATTMALANECKAKINAIIAALKA